MLVYWRVHRLIHFVDFPAIVIRSFSGEGKDLSGQISSRPKTRLIGPPNGGDSEGNLRKFQGNLGW